MKRFAFIVAAMTAFNAAVLATSPPTPTRTPTPKLMPTWAGPTLDVTFSGMVVFRKKAGGFRVVLADRTDEAHQAYIRYKTDDVATNGNTFKDPVPFDCEGEHYEWVRLTAHRLRVIPAAAIADTGPLDPSLVDNWLVHLSHLAKNNSFDDANYNQANPAAGKVAAQIDLTTGTLLPSVMDSVYYPVQWEFKDGNASPSPPVHICGTSGIRWLLRLKPGTQTITLEAPSKSQQIILKVTPGKTTTIIVGNSREEDIACPKAPPKTIDDDFKMHYKMLRTPVPVGNQYVPVRVSPEVQCTPPVPVPIKASRSQRGSDCMGGQWP